MFQCWVIVVVFHNILSFIIPIKYIYQILPRPYLGSYSGEKGHKIMQQSWIIALAKSVENFIIVSMILGTDVHGGETVFYD